MALLFLFAMKWLNNSLYSINNTSDTPWYSPKYFLSQWFELRF